LSRPRVAIVGAGVSGISAAYELRGRTELTIFERDERPGGHANTVGVRDGGRDLGIDTGFIVFNRRTYPQLSAFFEELGVESLDHSGGFNFFDMDSGLQYGTAELDLGKEEVRARYPEQFVNIWREARRFHRRGQRDYVRGRTNVPMGEYLEAGGYSEDFKYSYVILLGSAVWSVPAELIWEMPASTVIGFFMTHDPGGLGGREIDWKTVSDGSRRYVGRALEEIDPELRLSTEVTAVRELPDGVEVDTAGGGAERFDAAVVATHADQALAILEEPGDLARRVLSSVRYAPSTATLHSDPSVLPPDRSRWQSWNYGRVVRDGRIRTYVVWWMNKLQGFEAERDYFLTLDCPVPIARDAIVREIPYTHPVISVEVRDLQQEIYEVNEGGRVKLCGSYFHSKQLGPDLIASHEAAFSSGGEAGRAVLRQLEESSQAATVAPINSP
jgi:predicted NAD/FAD-binding protein